MSASAQSEHTDGMALSRHEGCTAFMAEDFTATDHHWAISREIDRCGGPLIQLRQD